MSFRECDMLTLAESPLNVVELFTVAVLPRTETQHLFFSDSSVCVKFLEGDDMRNTETLSFSDEKNPIGCFGIRECIRLRLWKVRNGMDAMTFPLR